MLDENRHSFAYWMPGDLTPIYFEYRSTERLIARSCDLHSKICWMCDQLSFMLSCASQTPSLLLYLLLLAWEHTLSLTTTGGGPMSIINTSIAECHHQKCTLLLSRKRLRIDLESKCLKVFPIRMISIKLRQGKLPSFRPVLILLIKSFANFITLNMETCEFTFDFDL